MYARRRQVWPLADSPYPPSVIRTRPADDGAVRHRLRLLPRGHPRTSTGATAPARRAGRVRPAADRPTRATDRWPDLLVLLGDQVYADETSAKSSASCARRRAPGHGGPADEVVDFDEYTRSTWSPGATRGALAAVHRAERDDLRRPRDHRRLEHLGRLAARTWPAQDVVARADHRRPGLATGSTSTWATSARTSWPRPRLWQAIQGIGRDDEPTTPSRCCAQMAEPRRRRARERSAGATSGTRATRGWSCSTTGPAGCSTSSTAGCSPTRSAPGSGRDAAGRRRASTTWCSARRCPGCCRPPSTTSSGGTRRSTPARTAAGAAGCAEKLRQAADLEHWAAFGHSFERLGRGADRRRPR